MIAQYYFTFSKLLIVFSIARNQAKAYSETKAEIEARKDPILFGMIKGRRILYYICDWVDEYCDLTLDQIADTIGKETIQEII
ncbi:MAG TPA: hypothetical protein VIE65_02365 [Methylobacter sp.]|jgi:hypothetical protein